MPPARGLRSLCLLAWLGAAAADCDANATRASDLSPEEQADEIKRLWPAGEGDSALADCPEGSAGTLCESAARAFCRPRPSPPLSQRPNSHRLFAAGFPLSGRVREIMTEFEQRGNDDAAAAAIPPVEHSPVQHHDSCASGDLCHGAPPARTGPCSFWGSFCAGLPFPDLDPCAQWKCSPRPV